MKLEQLGPYRIIRRVGRGGMGTVYEGVNVETGEPAAVKVLSTSFGQDEDFRQRFEGEVETLRKLNHPNIVRLFGFGEEDEHLFYAMELIDGTSLEEVLKHGQRFDWRQTMRIGIEMARALRHAHDRGVIHRDIKPANLLMAGDGQVKLSDFGIARLFGNSKLTNPGSVIGTVEYMAPEQADGRPVDPRSDLYSLGVVLYALLAGRPPFKASSLPEMLQKQRYDAPEPLRHYAPDVPPDLEAVIDQLLLKSPASRIPNATVLARRLEMILEALTPGHEGLSEEEDGFEVASPKEEEPSETAGADLPITRAWNEPPRASPAEAEEHAETRATSAFDSHKRAAGLEVPAEEEAQPPVSRFTPVEEEELDRIEAVDENHHALISLQTWVLIACLIGVAASVWYLLQPPSPDALYERIAAQAADGTVASLLSAGDDIESFLVRYAHDPRCEELRQYEREIDLYRLEKKLERRIRGITNGKALLPIEHDYLEAIQYLNLDLERGAARLQAIVDLYGSEGDSTGPTGQCLELARRKLEQLHKQRQEHVPGHINLLRERLEEAKRISTSDPEAARRMWRATIKLYSGKPWAAKIVAEAEAALAASRERADRVASNTETQAEEPPEEKPGGSGAAKNATDKEGNHDKP